MLADEVGDGVRRLGEGHAHETKGCTGDHCGEDAFDVDLRDRGHAVDCVVDSPGIGHQVSDEGGDHAGGQGLVAEAADGEYFDAEEGAGQRRSED